MDHTEQFLEQHADADGNVSDENILRLLTGAGEGDTAGAKPADSGAPAAGTDATTTAPAAEPAASPSAPADEKPGDKPADPPTDKPEDNPGPVPKSEAEAVILAKDGKHTIPYQKLADAREEARLHKARAEAAEAQLAERAKAPAAAPAAAAPSAPTETPQAADIFGDYSDEALKKGVETLVAQAVGKAKSELHAEFEPVKKQAGDAAAEAHFRTIYTAHPDTDSIVESSEYQQWLAAQPSFVRQAYEAVAAKGSAAQVVEMLSTYKAARPSPAPAPAPAPAAAAAPAVSAQKKAEEIVAGVKPKAPMSLSDIPTGSPVARDESEAIAEMDTIDLMNKMLGKSPADIERLITRLV